MIDINNILKNEFNLQNWQIDNTLKLKSEAATIPFIARYRKEMTGNLDENVLRDLFDRFDYLTELEERKQTVLDSIESQGKLTDELKKKIEECLSKTELEDLYLPYKPKKRTKAQIARERGLEPLAIMIKGFNESGEQNTNLHALATQFINPENEINTAEDAIQGANDIIAEEIAETAEFRKWLRDFIFNNGFYTADVKKEFEEGSTNYESYREFKTAVKSIAPHTLLALRRGETEKFLTLDIEFDEDEVLNYFLSKVIIKANAEIGSFYQKAVKEAFSRLMKHSIIGEIRAETKKFADERSIEVFESNLRQVLLSPPAGLKPVMGIDPGFRTGCKAVILDSTGKYIENKTIFPFASEGQKRDAASFIINKIKEHKIELIAIGNGTAGRETDAFVTEVIKDVSPKPIKVLVNESGASIYSASKIANEEFPELDLTIRGAISIARRLQDPLAELVKIDAKSIGVGQYQHDVEQKLLKKKLDETVESCVNYVGVDLNTASKELLTYVSGISARVAANIIKLRNEAGTFKSRDELKNVSGLGDKTFEQAAGFLRIRNGANPLDNTAVHPERYAIVRKIAKDLSVDLSNITHVPDKLKSIELKKYIDDSIGELTLKDIISELEKPGRDPREQFQYASFKEGINEMKDLKVGMELEGVVTNITNFGAFVDIGVHQDGLVHISEMANHFIKYPTKIVKVGQVVKVTVKEVNEKLKRIQLSMKKTVQSMKKSSEEQSYSMNVLMSKFNS